MFLAVAMGSLAFGGTALASSADQSVAYQLDAAHDGYLSNAPLGTPLVQQWSVSLPGAASYPLIVNGAVFVTAANSSGQGTTLYALNQATGSILWSRGLGGTYRWSGLAYDRGQLFTVNTEGTLSAIDPTSGSINWAEQLPGQYFFSSPPSAERGIVYVGGAGIGGTLYAVRELDGRLLWTQPVENGEESSPAVDNTSVYVTYPGQDYAFAAVTGVPVWHHDGGIEGGGGRTAVVAAGLLFARDPAADNLLFSGSDGSLNGSFTATPAPAVANGLAYMLSGSTLTAVNNSGQGTTSWEFSGDGSLDTAPLVVGGLVFVGSSSGELYALDASTGTTSWSTNVGTAIPAPDEQNVTQPLTGLGAGNGTIVVPAGQSLTEYRTAGAITDAPTNQAAPTIDGTPVVDQMLAADIGVWSGLPSSYSYQWQRCDSAGAGCTDISGATGPSYTLTPADVSSTVRVSVTASNTIGTSVPVPSTVTSSILPLPPSNISPPAITGNARQGQTLSESQGTWSNSPTSFGYTWERCDSSGNNCSAIPGATGQTDSLSSADVGHTIRVQETASNASGTSLPASSAATAVVLPLPPSNISPPAITGNTSQGQTLSESHGTWTNSPTSFGYTWERCDSSGNNCSAIPGATGQTDSLSSADVGHTIRVQETASNASGTSLPASSAATAVVLPLPPSNISPPAITGNTSQGQTLSESHGTWTNSPTSFGYTWERCDSSGNNCSAIPGATSPTYALAGADGGHSIRVAEIARNPGGSSVPAVSAPTGVVQAPPGPSGALTPPGTSGAVAPPGTSGALTIGRVTVSGPALMVPISCTGGQESTCKLAITLTIIETVKGGKVIAVTAAKKPKRKVVVLGNTTLSLSAGQTQTVRLSLNGTGKRLLAKYRALRAKLAITESGKRVSTETITFKAKPKNRTH